jgi:adenylosuccinate synthase
MTTANRPHVHGAVAGLQWGDEGKGKIVDLLTEQYDYIVRYNGGANAGHSVQIGDERYALHLIPSGILNPGKINVIANGVVIDPGTLIEEIDMLAGRGIDVGDNFRISSRAHLVFPYHKQQDALLEAAVSASRGDGKKIGTTGRGIGPAYSDKMLRTTGIRVGDLLDADRFRDKLSHIVRVKNAMLAAIADLADAPFEPYDARSLADQYLGYGEVLRPHIGDTTALLHDAIRQGKMLLFEGANGSMLDIDHGTYPYVTSSNCGSVGIYAGSGVPGGTVQRVVGIMKAYTTRVGAGPFATELHDEVGDRIRERGKEFGTTTGRPRRCGWLDLAVIKYTASVNGVTELAVMLLDVLAGFDELKVCTGYTIGGKTCDSFPNDAASLGHVEPIYETVSGFNDEITACRRYDDLPAGARSYVELIERVTEVPVGIISVGPERSQTFAGPRSTANTANPIA